MHELSIIQDLFKVLIKIATEKKLRKVSVVYLKIGKLRQIVPEFLEFAFSTIAKDSVAEGAKLVIEFIPITMRCNSCDKEFTVEEDIFFCPGCESGDLTLISGKELILESIEGDQDAKN